MNTYRLLDCGDQKKVEIFGQFKLIRPCPQALWQPTKPELWKDIDAEFERTGSETGEWKKSKKGFPERWELASKNGLKWKIEPNSFGNLGIFTEHWSYADELANYFDKSGKILNLFCYSGSNCMSLIRSGFSVTAVDSSKGAMDSYAYNLDLNNLPREGQRLILEDAYKFMARENRRGAKYTGIIMDAPSYGRGTKGEVFKIEDDLVKLLSACKELLIDEGKLVITLHSPRFTPVSLRVLCQQVFPGKKVEANEIVQICESGVELPSGFLVKIG